MVAGEGVGREPPEQTDALAAKVERDRVRLRAAEMERSANGRIAARESAGKPNGQHLMTGKGRDVQTTIDRERIGIGRRSQRLTRQLRGYADVHTIFRTDRIPVGLR